MKFLTIAVAAMAFGLTGCNFSVGTNMTPSSNSNSTTTNSSNKPANTSATPAAETKSSGSMVTPTDTYKTAYEYRKNKDIEGLKKVMSKDLMEFVTEMGKDDKKTLDDSLKELCEKPQSDKPESRNEKIEGDHATLEVKDEKGVWGPLDFEKVGSDWKMTVPKADKKGDGDHKKP